jgi:hypothetical protein
MFLKRALGAYPGPNVRMLSTASRLALRFGTGGSGQKLLPTVVAAKVKRLSIAISVECGGFVHGHSADGVFGHRFRFLHGHVSSLVAVVVTVFSFRTSNSATYYGNGQPQPKYYKREDCHPGEDAG